MQKGGRLPGRGKIPRTDLQITRKSRENDPSHDPGKRKREEAKTAISGGARGFLHPSSGGEKVLKKKTDIYKNTLGR